MAAFAKVDLPCYEPKHAILTHYFADIDDAKPLALTLARHEPIWAGAEEEPKAHSPRQGTVSLAKIQHSRPASPATQIRQCDGRVADRRDAIPVMAPLKANESSSASGRALNLRSERCEGSIGIR